MRPISRHATDEERAIILEQRKMRTQKKKGKPKKKKSGNAKMMKEYRENNPICENCHNRKSRHTHHIVPTSKGGADNEENYIAVCIPCHSLFHPYLPSFFFTDIED